MIKKLKEKIKHKIFKSKNSASKKYFIPKQKFDIDYFKNIEWFSYGNNYYPYHILKIGEQKFFIPYIQTKRDKEGNTIINEFLITKN